MRKYAKICLVVPFVFSHILASSFYVANNGSDNAATNSQATPWATIAKAATAAHSGDQILLRRGDLFRESVDFSASGITIADYGTAAAKPIVSGSAAITGWTRQAGTPQMSSLFSIFLSIINFRRSPDIRTAAGSS